MTTATATEESATPLTEAQTLADEEAGFNSITTPTGSETDTPAAETAVTPSPESAAASETVAETVETAPPVKFAEITDEAFQRLLAKATEVDEIKAALEQRFNGMSGKVGGLERILNEMKASTASGKKAEVSREDLKELLEEFPEFGERALTGLNRALAKVQIGSITGDSLTPDAVNELIAKREEAREIKRLTKLDKEWVTIIGPHPSTLAPGVPISAYHQWLLTQPTEYQNDINQSVDADDIHASIVKFKASTAPPPKTPPSKPALTERERELRAAIPLKSAGSGPAGHSAIDEESAMDQAYKAESKRFS